MKIEPTTNNINEFINVLYTLIVIPMIYFFLQILRVSVYKLGVNCPNYIKKKNLNIT